MPRAYTKSGSIEKYESGQWATPVWSSSNKGTITGPDSNGNYTVNAPSGYVSGGSEISCTTKYGGVSKVFWFHKDQPTTCHIQGSALYLNGRTTCQITIEYYLNSDTTNCTWYFSSGKSISGYVTMTNGSHSVSATATQSEASNTLTSFSLSGYSEGQIVNGYRLVYNIRH